MRYRSSFHYSLFLFFLVGWGVLPQKSLSQSEGGGLDPQYNRIGLTPVLVKPDSIQYDHSLKDAFSRVRIPEKFDDNQVSEPHVDLYLPGTLTSSGSKEKEKKKSSTRSSDRGGGGEGDLTGVAGNLIKDQVENRLSAEITTALSNPLYDSLIRRSLKERGVVHRVVDSLYAADEAGRYSLDRLLKRAKYNLTDAEAKRLESSAKGLEEGVKDMKWANRILTSNYIMGFYFHDLRSMDEVYDEQGVSEDDRIYGGYEAEVSVHLYRIDLNDSVRSVFYNNCWAGKEVGDEALAKAKEARDEMDYPLEHVRSFMFTVNSKKMGVGSSTSAQKGLFMDLGTESLKKGASVAEREVDAFKVRTSLLKYKLFPLPYAYSKIGRKEGLSGDDRYFVYEYVASDDGEVEKKRKGVLRATTKISRNDTTRVGNTEPSRFIQTAGWGLDKGMLIEQRSDLGMAISLGWLDHGAESRFLNARAELRISKMMGISPSWHLYGDAGLHLDDHSDLEEEYQELRIGSANDSDSFETGIRVFGAGFGVSKEFYFLNHFHLAPYLGLRREKTRFTDDSLHTYIEEDWEEYGTTWTLDAGARFGVNITYWMKLVGSVGFAPVSYGPEDSFFGDRIPSKVNDGSGELRFPGLAAGQQNPFQQERRNLKWDLMLRLSF